MAYCTLFDSYYSALGLTMIRMFRKYNQERIYIFPFDELTHDLLVKADLMNVVIIRQEAFETDQLREIKPKRTVAEYCFTCTPWIIRHVLKEYDESHCVYLDADLGFYNDADLLLSEVGWNQLESDETNFESHFLATVHKDISILLTSHKFASIYKNLEARSSTYNVQFIGFLNDVNGKSALNWWCDECCKPTPGKFSDQVLLNDWLDRFEGVHVLQHPGHVAPWNVVDYEFVREYDELSLKNITQPVWIRDWPVVLYHFHNLCEKRLAKCYRISRNTKIYIYDEYFRELEITKELYNLENVKYGRFPRDIRADQT